MAQQTAVEWLEKQLDNNLDIKHSWRTKQYIEQAKQMEKEQHDQTWKVAHQAGRFEGKGIAEENWQTFEQYYNETFGKQ